MSDSISFNSGFSSTESSEEKNSVGVNPTLSQKVFSQVMKERKESLERNDPFSQIATKVRSVFSRLAAFACCSCGITQSVTPAPEASPGIVAVAARAFLAISGLGLVINAIKKLDEAFLHNNLEKAGLAVLEFLSGLSGSATGLIVLMEWAPRLISHLAKIAWTGATLPIAAMCLYATSFVSAAYKLYVLTKFRSELNAKVEREGFQSAFQWIKSKTELSDQEEMADESSMLQTLHRKWEKFTLRAGTEALSALMDRGKIDELIKKGDVSKAKAIIENIQAKNNEEIKWQLLATVGNLVGVGASITYMVLTGGTGSIISSVSFGIASAATLLVDSEKARSLAKRGFTWFRIIHGSSLLKTQAAFLSEKSRF